MKQETKEMPIKDMTKRTATFRAPMKIWEMKKGEGKTWAWKISRGRRLAKKQ